MVRSFFVFIGGKNVWGDVKCYIWKTFDNRKPMDIVLLSIVIEMT